MSAETKKFYKLYMLTDYEQEEKWLREMANKGWKLQSVQSIVYTFEKIEPQDIVYKLDFQDTKVSPNDEYLKMLEDYGWTYLTSVNNFRYLYKEATGENDLDEIYTDNASKLDMLKRIYKTRILPILVLFLCAVIPNFVRAISGGFTSNALIVLWIVLMALYCFIIVKVGMGYKRLYQKFSE